MIVPLQHLASPTRAPAQRITPMLVNRRTFTTSLLATASVCSLQRTASAQQLKSLKVTAPANPGGGYDQLARAMQDALTTEKLATGVQVVNMTGGGGTVGLAQFANAKERDPALLVAGLGMVGAIIINKAPVNLDQVTPLARLQGEYQPLFVAANSPIKTLKDLIDKFKDNPGSVSWGGFAPGSPDHILSGLVVKAAGGDVKKMNYITIGAGGEMLPLVMSGKLRAIGISSPERLPGVDIPTFREQGVDATLVNWRGVMAPKDITQRTRRSSRTPSARWSRVQPGRKSAIKGSGSASTCRPPSSPRL
jgi:putative tricarboxylic transport membrane protein